MYMAPEQHEPDDFGGRPTVKADLWGWGCVMVQMLTGEAPWPAGSNRSGVQGVYLNPLGLFLRTSIPFIWRILSSFLRA